MECKDRTISAKLSDYFWGHLPDSDKAAVETHLATCRECQASLKMMRLISRGKKNSDSADASEHVSPELLAKYYEHKEELDEEKIREIESHLEKCDQCSYDLYFLSSLEDELSRSLEPEIHKASVLEKILSSIPVIVRKPAFAYLLLLLTIYPAARWLFQPDSDRKVAAPGMLPARVFQVTEMRRSGGEASTVWRTEDNPVVQLTIPFYHSTDNFHYSFQFFSEEDRTPFQIESISDFRDKSTINMLVNTAPVPDGNYILTILEIDREDRSDTSKMEYPFELNTER